MDNTALVVTIEFQPEARAPFLQAMLSHRQRCLATEPGTLQFEVLAPADHASSVVLFELYANPDALRAHEAGASLAQFRQEAGPFITNVVMQQCAVLGA